MLNYVLRRLALMVPTLLGILLVSFVIIQFVPGGPVEQLVHQLQGASQGAEGGGAPAASGYRGRQGLDKERIAEIEAFYGFDKPAPTRFVEMLGRYLRFDLGESFHYQQSVWSLIVQKLPVSISLGVWSFFIVYLVSIPLGIAKAVRDGSRFDAVTGMVVLVGYTIPPFVLGLVLLVLFGGGSFFAWFPQGGLVGDDFDTLSWAGKIKDYLWHMALPITASVAGSLAVTTVLTKNVFLEEIRRQYVYTARAKGLPEKQILWKHVFRNAMIPLITGFPAAFIGAFFTGSLLIETLFSLDGLGLLSYEAVMKRDYPVVMGTLYVFTLMGLLAKLVSDISYSWVDPRIHFGGQK